MLSLGSEEDTSPEGGLWRAELLHCHHSCGWPWASGGGLGLVLVWVLSGQEEELDKEERKREQAGTYWFLCVCHHIRPQWIYWRLIISSSLGPSQSHTCPVLFLVAQPCWTLCDIMNCSTLGFPVLHNLPELAQTHAHWVSDAIQASCPLSSPSSPALLPSFPSVSLF